MYVSTYSYVCVCKCIHTSMHANAPPLSLVLARSLSLSLNLPPSLPSLSRCLSRVSSHIARQGRWQEPVASLTKTGKHSGLGKLERVQAESWLSQFLFFEAPLQGCSRTKSGGPASLFQCAVPRFYFRA